MTARPNAAPERSAHPADRHLDIPADWLDFGSDDPLDAERWINACAACGEAPPLEFADLRWQVKCACGQCGAPAQLNAIAAVNWNKSPLSIHPHYRELPFFSLAGLTIPKARTKLIAVREYLEEQKRRCERRIRARENFGHRYFQRIRAYLAWTIYAQGLVREAEISVIEQASRKH
ncbi:hypothetical protein [Lysobacter humi (ex Lee et al. 2017)]